MAQPISRIRFAMISKSRFKKILALKQKKGRAQQKRFLIEGFRLCQEALRSDFDVEMLLINSDVLPSHKSREIIQLAQQQQPEVIYIEQSEGKRLADTVHSQGVFCVVKQKSYHLEPILQNRYARIVIVNGGQDPGNVGTLIRTCDWFGIDAVLLSHGTVELFNPKLIRATMGSIFHLPIIEPVDLQSLLPQLRGQGYHIFGAEVNGTDSYDRIPYPVPVALVIGSENQGIDAELRQYFDKTIRISRYGKAESLNMAMAGAIIISRMVNQKTV